MKERPYFYFFSILCCSIGFSYYLYINSSNQQITKIQKTKIFSTKEEAKSIYIKRDFIDPGLIFSSQIKKNQIKNTKVIGLKTSYNTALLRPSKHLGSDLVDLEDMHLELMNKMREEGIKIDALTSLKPRLTIALSYYLGLNPGEMTLKDLEQIKLSNKEWYILKTFSESKDFVLMLKRESLSKDFIQIDSLTLYYSKNS